MNIRKVILIEPEGPKRDEHKEFLESMGYEVKPFPDGMAALKAIVSEEHDPSVVAGPFAMGDVYTADEMKRCLAQHTARTGVQYGIISFDVPQHRLPIEVLKNAKVHYTHGADAEDIARLVGDEFRSVEFMSEAKQRIEDFFGDIK